MDPARYRLDAAAFRRAVADTPLAPWCDELLAAVDARGPALRHGDLPRWRAALERLPDLAVATRTLDARVVSVDVDSESIGARVSASDSTDAHARPLDPGDRRARPPDPTDAPVRPSDPSGEHDDPLAPAGGHDRHPSPADPNGPLRACLAALSPWRKGPFRIADVEIDCEWRSDRKWDRLVPHLAPLAGRLVLDVGCGSGYHLWRLRGAGAAFALGIDPGLLFGCQFAAIQRYVDDPRVRFLPLTLDALPSPLALFDTVLSMGVLYHRRDPAAHLAELRAALRPGGELALETLVSPSEDDDEIPLGGRYARMRNVHALPSTARVARWIAEAAFEDVRLVSVDVTSTDEQRSTAWMPHQSLVDALDPTDPTLTVEGHPRPRRAILLARRPDEGAAPRTAKRAG